LYQAPNHQCGYLGTLINRHPVEQVTTVVGGTIAFPTLFLAAKMMMKITSLAFVLENELVNPLMADCYLAHEPCFMTQNTKTMGNIDHKYQDAASFFISKVTKALQWHYYCFNGKMRCKSDE